MNRYSRQILIPWIGEEGQKLLGEKHVLIVGCGALGTVSANHLVRGGVGHVRIVDRDFVELDNLQRQMLYTEEDANLSKPKAIAARDRLLEINSQINIESEISDVTVDNIEIFLDGMDLVVDATDNFETRFIINDACVKHGIPWIYGACVGTTGMTMNLALPEGPCLRCIMQEAPPPGILPTCDTAGILSTVSQTVGSLQANEALKILINNPDVSKAFIHFDLVENEFERFTVAKREDCPACEKGTFEYLDKKGTSSAVTLCGRNAVQITPKEKTRFSIEELAKRLEKIGDVTFAGYLVKFKKGAQELVIFPDGRTLVKGTTDLALARSLYSKYVGM